MDASSPSKTRLVFLDNLRTLMIVFVVVMHAAVTYSGFGSWYYVESSAADIASRLVFGLYQSFTQAYFMSLLFLIAGYLVPGSLYRKGVRRFVGDRLFRLGVPLLVYIFLLHPLCVWLSHPEVPIARFIIHGIVSFDFLSWTGPLWFALALCIYTAAYLALSRLTRSFGHTREVRFTTKGAVVLIGLIAVAAFLIRTVFPIGSSVVNLQLCYFAAYTTLFTIGILASRNRLLEQIGLAAAKPWFIVSLAAGIPLWLLLMAFGGPMRGVFLISGGLNWQAFSYALWESFVCIAMIIGLIGMFCTRVNSQTRLWKFLSDNSFGVFVFHSPILIGITVALKAFALHPLLKWAMVSSITVPVSFVFSSVIRRQRVMRKVFS